MSISRLGNYLTLAEMGTVDEKIGQVHDTSKNIDKNVAKHAEMTHRFYQNWKDDTVFQRTLDSLKLFMMNTQRDMEDAYPSTFEWILDPDSDHNKPGGSFLEWLRTGEDIYWISGKPGSGKSTVSP